MSMEYQVPQFIEVEDKIFGPFTWQQFIYIAGGAGICVVLFLYVRPLVLTVLLAAPIAAFAAALAFYRVNNKPFVEMLEAGLNYYLGGRLYLWKKAPPKNVAAAPVAPPAIPARQKLALSESKLKELAWSLDIQEKNPAS